MFKGDNVFIFGSFLKKGILWKEIICPRGANSFLLEMIFSEIGAP